MWRCLRIGRDVRCFRCVISHHAKFAFYKLAFRVIVVCLRLVDGGFCTWVTISHARLNTYFA